MRRTRALFAVGAAAALVVSAPMPLASANTRPPIIREWSNQVIAPFSIAVDGARVLVADGATGVIGQLKTDGSFKSVVTDVPGLAGLATRGEWLAYGSSVADETTEPPVISASYLNIRNPRGKVTQVDLRAFEVKHNPDGKISYGFTDPASCGNSMAYTGLIDSHVYAVAAYGDSWLVADAGSNAIYKVSDRGRVSVVAVLPPVPVTVTAEMAAQFGMPDCVVGDTYYAEGVPTDVAVGRDGMIYATSLPGVPGDGGPFGVLYKINPWNGKVTEVADGLSGPTSLAISGRSIYVAELFGQGVSSVKGSKASLFAALPGALSVATGPNGTVWAATMASEAGPGKLVSISNHRVIVRGHFRHR